MSAPCSRVEAARRRLRDPEADVAGLRQACAVLLAEGDWMDRDQAAQLSRALDAEHGPARPAPRPSRVFGEQWFALAAQELDRDFVAMLRRRERIARAARWVAEVILLVVVGVLAWIWVYGILLFLTP